MDLGRWDQRLSALGQRFPPRTTFTGAVRLGIPWDEALRMATRYELLVNPHRWEHFMASTPPQRVYICPPEVDVAFHYTTSLSFRPIPTLTVDAMQASME